MKLLHLTESQAIAYWGSKLMKRKLNVYRRLKDGSYKHVGAIYWDINYCYIPIKQKHWSLIFFSQIGYGDIAKPERG